MGFVAVLALAVGLCRRGAGTALVQLRIRAAVVLPAALGLQILVVNVLPGLPHAVGATLHLVSYALFGVFLIGNFALPGMPVVAAGTAANVVAIAANGGVLPASETALQAAGWTPGPDVFANSAALTSPRLAFLGDNYVTPAWVPFGNVFSLGDVVIAAGIVVLVLGITRRRPRHLASGRHR